MSRLVIVSNRVADLRKRTQTGGLAVGLADAIRSRGGIWFGWNGEIIESGAEEAEVEAVGEIQMISLPLSREDYSLYYLGYANSVLWPLFHYRIDLVEYEDRAYAGYRRVNQLFANALVPHLREDDIIWVHDYHLISLGEELRRLGCKQKIGFFLHIPFPPPDVLTASPNHNELVGALLCYDLIGLQTNTDVANLEHYCEVHPEVHDADRPVPAAAFPIGIDVDDFGAMAAKATEEIQIDRIRRGILGRKQIIGVDRLDYSKGLPERMRAFERLLTLYPERQKTVSYLQIAPPTREEVAAYNDIRTELEGLAGAINGRYADFNWTPIRYIHRSVPRETLAALFRTSDVGFVTPLRDGMNLVAKEYVAAQDPEDPGVLVLSRFAGAAEELEEAIQVNPYDTDGVAQALHEALAMSLEDRQARHDSLLRRIRRQDAKAWLESFLDSLSDSSRNACNAA